VNQTIDRLLKDYPSAKSRLSGHPCNLGDQATVETNLKDLFEKVTSDGKKLDHVVYTAGDPLAMMKIGDVSLDKIIKAGMVRFFAPLLVGKLAPKYMNAGPKSSIALTTGSVSQKPRPDWSVIGSFATGLHGMCRGLALDLKPLRVNLISPGAVETELWDGMTEQQRKDMFDSLSKHLPTGRVPPPSDVAESYLYVLKDENCTGSLVSTNGGSLLV
jgi:NAD(P)-dependent dehydrogenase (short-subunit alcohol dehydrogenase family)